MIINRIFLDTSKLPVSNEPIYKKLFPIFKTRIEERSGATAENGRGDFTVSLELDPGAVPEAFKITSAEGGVVISGLNFNSLMFGIGQLLHKSHYSDRGIEVTGWRGESAPECPFRTIYFAIHFYNWYHTASAGELVRYFEDLMLWGYNGVAGIFGKINLTGWDDPGVETSYVNLEKLYAAAKELNMSTTFITANVDFMVPNKSVAGDKSGIHSKTGNTVCPSRPGGYEYILSMLERTVRRLAKTGLDNIIFFPYDEGGCSCEKCAPWGGNGYYKMAKRLYGDIKKIVPNVTPILSTWHFMKGINDKRDFEWLDRAITEDRAAGNDWVKYIMLETRDGMPEYIKKNGTPGGLMALDFPEITMRRLEPWGGFGAASTPVELSNIWNELKGIMHGGMPYSEGKYDDINKAYFAGFLWEKNRDPKENFNDYCGYEFTPDVADRLYEMSVLLERNQYRTHVDFKQKPDMAEVERALLISAELDAELPERIKTSWRWRIFRIRAILDYERYAGAEKKGFSFEGLVPATRFGWWRQFMLGDRLAQSCLAELIRIYNMPEVYNTKTMYGHYLVRPNYAPIIENFDSYYKK